MKLLLVKIFVGIMIIDEFILILLIALGIFWVEYQDRKKKLLILFQGKRQKRTSNSQIREYEESTY